MSVRKNFRFSELNSALLEVVAEREDRTQTEVLEELVFQYVVNLPSEEMSEIIKEANSRMTAK